MDQRRELALKYQNAAVGLAKQGHFGGVVGTSPFDPQEAMILAQLHDFEWDPKSGNITVSWPKEESPGEYFFQVFLRKVAQHELALRAMKASDPGSDFPCVWTVVREILVTKIPFKANKNLNLDLLDIMAASLGLKVVKSTWSEQVGDEFWASGPKIWLEELDGNK